jgi:hypothetical protein
MKTLVHKQQSTDICIQSFTEKKVIGTFFKDKPSKGDLIMSHVRRGGGFLWVYEVLSVIKNRDARISSSCPKDNSNAYFELEVVNVTEDNRFEEFDNSVVTHLN